MAQSNFLQDILSVPARNGLDHSDAIDVSTMDLERFAFGRCGKDASLCGASQLGDIFPTSAPWLSSAPLPHLPMNGALEVPSWDPQQQQQQQQQLQLQQLQLPRHGSDNRQFPLLAHQDSFSSDDGFSTSASDVGSPEAAGNEEERKPSSPTPSRPTPNAGGDRELPVLDEEDAAMEDEMLMSPEEEARLRTLLAKKQRDLENCATKMKGLTPQNKKRLRNRHASCVSRLKKKLYICNLQRDLERAKAVINALQADSEAQKGTIAFFRKENDRLCGMVQQKANLASIRAVPE